jgi:putative transposase
MRGFKSFVPAERFCRSHGERRDLLRLRARHNQRVLASRRRRLHLRRVTAALAILEAA